MKPTTLGLCAALVISNGWWIYYTVDHAVTEVYREQERYELANRNAQLTALATVLVQQRDVEDVRALLKHHLTQEEPYIKEGSLRTTWLEFPIGSDGKIQGTR